MDLHKTLSLDDVKAVIHSGEDIIQKDHNGWTPLMHAVEEGSEDIVKNLCENNADLNVQSLYKKETALSLAVKSYRLSSLRVLITSGADINQRDSDGRTPLMWAVEHGFEEIVRLLCENNADLNVQCTTFRDTAVSLAAEYNRSSCVKILIESGADINPTDYKGWTPLMHASRHGFEEIVRLLCKNNAELNVNTTALQDTAVSLAAKHYKSSCLKILIESGADINQIDYIGWTPLMIAARNGFEEIVRLLCENKADLNVQSDDLNTAVTLASEHDKPSCLELLIKSGADATLKTSSGKTALDIASFSQNKECILILQKHMNAPTNALWDAVISVSLDDVKTAITSGEDINQRDSNGWTPLMQAVNNDSEDIVKYLCGNGANLNVQSLYNEDTAVSLAAQYGKPSCIKILIESGADINLPDYTGWTPLMYASYNGFDDIVKLLCENHADVSMKTSSGNTAFGLATLQQTSQCVQILGKYNKINGLWDSIKSGYLDDVKAAITSGADISKKGHNQWTPLMQAVLNGSEDIVKYLCQSNAHLNSKSLHDDTAVSLAVDYNKPSCLKILIESGADINQTDCIHGWTPLMHASKNGCEEIVRLLCENNADLNVQSRHTLETSVTLAAEYNKPSCLEILIESGADFFLNTSSRNTALELAIQKQNTECVQILRKYNNGLWQEIKSGSLDDVKAAFLSGADINQMDSSGKTLLMYAVMKGSEDVVQYLCENNAKLNVQSTISRDTALSLAAKYNKLSCVKIIIESGADINTKDHNGWTPLMHAVLIGSKNIVKYLCKNYADLNVQSHEGNTAATLAEMYNKRSCLEVLQNQLIIAFCDAVKSESLGDVKAAILSGADINQRDSIGYTPLMHAAVNGSEDIVKYLCENNADLNIQNCTHWTAVTLAARYKKLSCVKILIESGADINQRGRNGWTPLMYAAVNGSEDLVKYLCENNANLNIQNCTHWTAVTLAARYNKPSCLEVLIKAGADVFLKTSSGKTALELAIQEENTECVQILKEHSNNSLWKAVSSGRLNDVKTALNSGANINQRGSSGWTLLMQAVQNGSEEVVRLLCENNIDLYAQSATDERTAILLATELNRPCCLRILLDFVGTDIIEQCLPALLLASKLGHLNCIGALLRYKEVMHLDSPLKVALENGHTRCARLLLQHKADPNHMDKVGETPLFHEIKAGRLRNVQLLVIKGANIDFAAGVSKISPLMTACSLGRVNIVQYLCRRGAKMQLKDSMEATAFDYAKEAGHKDCMETLTQFENNPSLVQDDCSSVEDSNSG